MRDKLIEVMARAMDPAAWAEHRMGWQEWNQRRATSINNATAALAALEAEGYRVVPDKMRNFHLAQLRHAYEQLAAFMVEDQKGFADGLLAPIIRQMEAAQGKTDE